MTSEWQSFLQDNIRPDGKLSTGTVEPLAVASCFAMPDEVVLHVSGADAGSFLQGQFSNDIEALADPGSQLTTWSTPKGRVLALFRLIRNADHFLIRLPAALSETFVKRLRMYVMMSKVTIEPQEHLVTFGVAGAGAGSLIEKFVGRVPLQPDDCVAGDEVWVVKVPGQIDRYEVTASVSQAMTLLQSLSEGAIGSENDWRLQNIDAGLPSIGEANSEAFVLQMLNLQHINGVSFKKGCFPGQEVVARMQYLGKLKRRMYLLTGPLDAELPVPGDELYSAGKSSAVGKVVDAQPAGDGSYRMLAVCAIEAMEQPVYREVEAKSPLQSLALPYSLDAA
jgi:folate-binding protein YgfZ